MTAHETTSVDRDDTAVEAAGNGAYMCQASVSNMRGQAPDKSMVLDAALNEFSLRRKVNEHVDISDFCDAYPAYRSSVRRLLSVYQCFAENPDIAEGLALIHWPELGRQFLGFTIREELGQGAFARVYSACEPAMGNREVVLKVAMGGAAEAETLGRLSHPNVVTVYSVQVDAESGLSAICMPSVARQTLCDVLDDAFADQLPPTYTPLSDFTGHSSGLFRRLIPARRRLWSETVLEMGVKLAGALAYTHSEGILHLDLKPSNVLIAPNGEPILIDFNLSKDSQSDFVQAGGTLPYMSPEQLQALSKSSRDLGEMLDVRSDVFSLGVVLYEALTGRLPFGHVYSSSDKTLLLQELIDRRKRPPKPVRLWNRSVDHRASDAIERCLAFDPADRFQTADELADCLRGSLTSMAHLKCLVRLHPVTATLICTVLTLSTIGGAAWWAQRPTFAEREYATAIALYGNGKNEEAMRCLDRLFLAEGPSFERLLARGWVHQAAENWEWAAVDFEAANKLAPSGNLLAMLAYCRARAGRNPSAIVLYQKAIDAGYATAGIYNNLGVSFKNLGSPIDAYPCFEEAIRLDENLQAAYANRASIVVNECHRGNFKHLEQAINDIQKAIAIGPASAELFYNAAVLLALCKDAEKTPEILDYLSQAVEHGLSTEVLRVDPMFKNLVDDPRFPQDSGNSTSGKYGSTVARIVTPKFVPGSGLPEF